MARFVARGLACVCGVIIGYGGRCCYVWCTCLQAACGGRSLRLLGLWCCLLCCMTGLAEQGGTISVVWWNFPCAVQAGKLVPNAAMQCRMVDIQSTRCVRKLVTFHWILCYCGRRLYHIDMVRYRDVPTLWTGRHEARKGFTDARKDFTDEACKLSGSLARVVCQFVSPGALVRVGAALCNGSHTPTGHTRWHAQSAGRLFNFNSVDVVAQWQDWSYL